MPRQKHYCGESHFQLIIMFNPARLRDDYVPSGFRPYGVKTYAVKGHPFGLDLNEGDKKALIAFLKTP